MKPQGLMMIKVKSDTSKKGAKSINKGKRGEREWRDFLRSQGFEARRGKQYSGDEGRDVICPGMPEIHHEVKYQEAVPKKVYEYIEQAANDAQDNLPIVAMRRNDYDWLVVMKADDWMKIVKESTYVVGVYCPDCKSAHVIKNGLNDKRSKHKFICKNPDCKRYSFNYDKPLPPAFA
jgi:Holliday junction resolvase